MGILLLAPRRGLAPLSAVRLVPGAPRAPLNARRGETALAPRAHDLARKRCRRRGRGKIVSGVQARDGGGGGPSWPRGGPPRSSRRPPTEQAQLKSFPPPPLAREEEGVGEEDDVAGDAAALRLEGGLAVDRRRGDLHRCRRRQRGGLLEGQARAEALDVGPERLDRREEGGDLGGPRRRGSRRPRLHELLRVRRGLPEAEELFASAGDDRALGNCAWCGRSSPCRSPRSGRAGR